jgi:hypothetical protein
MQLMVFLTWTVKRFLLFRPDKPPKSAKWDGARCSCWSPWQVQLAYFIPGTARYDPAVTAAKP